MPYGIGIDVGGTTCKLGLFSEKGLLIEKWEIETDTRDNGKNILDDLSVSVFKKIEEKNISARDVVGVGMGIPGPVLENGIVNKCVNLGWGVFNIEKEMKEKTGFFVKAGNDANVAALGEYWQGAAKEYKSSVMITLGTGVGGGIVINGKILNGAFGAAGEIGHIKVKDYDKETCGCGNSGCLEQYTSATGISRMARELLNTTKFESSLRKEKVFSAKTIFEEAKKGDELSLKVVQEVTTILGTVLANLACTINPEIIVIGGGVSKAGEELLNPLKEVFLKKCFHACANTEMKIATLGNDAGIYGAAKLILNV